MSGMRGNGRKALVVGAGPVGCLAAVVLGRRGYTVEVYEKRPHFLDKGIGEEGRTINLSISPRGLNALASYGFDAEFVAAAVPVHSRALHLADGSVQTRRYGADDWCTYSIGRNELNLLLMRGAQRIPKVRFTFEAKCTDVDFTDRTATFDLGGRERTLVDYDLLVGADGAYSAVRDQMSAAGLTTVSMRELGSVYRELTIRPRADDRHLTSSSIHIWPRGRFFMVALSKRDGSLCATLVLPSDGPHADANPRDPDSLDQFFLRHFPDAAGRLPGNAREPRPGNRISIVSCTALTHASSVLLLGDAAHALAPFLGQGVNVGLEDCVTLGALLEKYGDDQHLALPEYDRERHGEGEAAAALSLSNYAELSGTEQNAPSVTPAELPLAVLVNFLGLSYQETLDRYQGGAARLPAAAAHGSTEGSGP
jgi:kynurenine 3-monooxygenase